MKQTKFLLSVFMAIVMLAMSPMKSWAQSPIQVSTAEEFISAIENNTTVSIQLTQDITFEALFSGRKNITIDLNNHTLSHRHTSSSDYAFSQVSTLNIKNGTFNGNGRFVDLFETRLTIDNCHISTWDECMYVGYNSTITINNNAEIYSSRDDGSAEAIEIFNGTLNINGTCTFCAAGAVPLYNISGTINIHQDYKLVDKNGNEITNLSGDIGESGQYVYVIPASRCAAGTHTMDHHVSVPATCTSDGTVEYWRCTTCGGIYANELGSNPLSESQLNIHALGHNMDANGECTRCHLIPTLLEEGEYTGVDIPAIPYSIYSLTDANNHHLFRFVAPGTGTLTVTGAASGDDVSSGALFNANLGYLTYNNDHTDELDFTLNYDVTGGTTYYIGISPTSNLAFSDYTITISGTWPVAITDGESYSTEKQYSPSADRVSMARTFTADKPSTVMLPFTVPASQIGGATFHEFKGVAYDSEKSEWIATMQAVSTVEAYKPYVVIPTATSLTFGTDAEAVTFPVTSTSTGNLTQTDAETGWTFVALNENKTWTTGNEEIGKAYGFAGTDKEYDGYSVAKGEFVKIAAGASAKPGRCYLVKEGALPGVSNAPTRAAEELPATIKVRFINGDTLGIGTLDTETGEMTLEGWYDLNGNKIEQPSKGGVYINNNKKVMVK